MEWSYVEIALVAVAAAIMAVDEGVRRAPSLNAVPHLRGLARFVPAVLVSAAAIVFVFHQTGVFERSTPTPQASGDISKSATMQSPLHDDALKYKLVRDINAAIKSRVLPQPCHITIVHYPSPFSEAFALDFKDLFTAGFGWAVDDKIATTTLPRGLSVRGLRTGESSVCAEYMNQRLRNRFNLPVDFQLMSPEEAPSYLRECDHACIEIGIGNEPG